ncbi:glucosaminidase domain-containing protein [Candidatus Gottesmanbacteria bacterium]|nr:glucosaminidase domain-containing protein [Candidatus Gottesmanbacteria bacterium]
MKHVKTVLTTLLFLVALGAKAQPILAVETVAETAGMLAAVAPIPKDTRAQRLEAYLASHDSPLTQDADFFVSEADRLNIDWKLVAAIAGVESTFGKQIPTGSYNAWGWGVFTGALDGVHFTGWRDGITQVSEGLKTNYFDKGAKTIYDVGWIYAANGNSWGNHVQFFLDQIDKFTPNQPELLDITI